ncbi:MAG: NBR1-Ig-like domain-containing protein, partial [Patescibacteria group bacterium]
MTNLLRTPRTYVVLTAACVFTVSSFALAQLGSGNNAACLGINAPSVMQTGQKSIVYFKFKNTGTTTWTAGMYYSISALPERNMTWGVNSVKFRPVTVLPAQSAVATIAALAPSTPGTYELAWQMTYLRAPFGAICRKTVKVTPPQAYLRVTELSGPRTDTAVANQKDITLDRFKFYADRANLNLIEVEAKAAEGSLGNVNSYALWVDADGNGEVETVLQDGVQPLLGTVLFDNIVDGVNGFYRINSGQEVRMEIRGDVNGSLGEPPQLRMTLARAEAETENGGPFPPEQVLLSQVAQTLWTFVDNGNLFVTKDTTPVRPRQLLGGTLGDTILRLNFRAEHEPVDVTNLQITNSGSTASAVERLELFQAGQTSSFGIATTSGCGTDDVPEEGTTFCASMQSQQLLIPRGGEVTVLVKPRLKNDEAGAVSGQHIQLTIEANNAMNNSIGT